MCPVPPGHNNDHKYRNLMNLTHKNLKVNLNPWYINTYILQKCSNNGDNVMMLSSLNTDPLAHSS